MKSFLVYDGPLKSNGDAREKQCIRAKLHPQIRLIAKNELFTRHVFKKKVGGKEFQSIASRCQAIGVKLSITMLRRAKSGHVLHGGDLDNRMKTLFDALSIPDENQVNSILSGGDIVDDPCFCLLEDDQLVVALTIRTHRLLKEPTGRSDPRVLAIIEVDFLAIPPSAGADTSYKALYLPE